LITSYRQVVDSSRKIGRYARFCLLNGAGAAYRTLVAREKRAVIAEFSDKSEQLTMIFARGDKSTELRELLFGAQLQPTNAAVSGAYDGSLGKNDEASIEGGARAALRSMRKHGRDILLVEFSEPVIEPLLGVYARGIRADELRDLAYASGLIDAPVAA
jgi:hypothetical protein